MPDAKQKLTELIEAYAAARSTGNSLLIQTSGANLIQFLEGCTIAVNTPEADGGEG